MEKKLRITHEGKTYIVTVEDLGESPSLAPGPQPTQPVGTPTTHVAAPAAPPASAEAAQEGDVVAPIGGVMQSVAVTVGQTVNRGETVAVLEAMKMNTVMTAPRAGKVTRVSAKPGDAVEAGQILVTID